MYESNTSRLEPYLCALEAYEIVDPSVDIQSFSDGARDETREICSLHGISYDELMEDLRVIRGRFSEANAAKRRLCKVNLLRLYHEYKVEGSLDDCPALVDYACAVFSQPIVTVFVETLFSGMKYNQSGSRSSVTDEKVVAILKTKDLENPLADCMHPTPPQMSFRKALDHELPPTFRV